MKRRKLNKRRASLFVVAPLLSCLLAGAGASAYGQKGARSADEILKLGFFYYNNDDVSDEAANQFRTVIAQYPRSAEAETAQFYLGAYYQRKYYVQDAKFRRKDTQALEAAWKEYRTYTDRYYKGGSHQWLADAFFNLALVYLQMGDTVNAGYELDKMSMAAALDDSVYLYQVVYSPNGDDVLDGSFPARRLADYTSSLVKEGGRSFEQLVAALRDWCREQRLKGA
ncbi:MAG TPA: hypothetical protein VJT74_17475 [Pyrinomonadaceae bacterium]|nr:hypothetical protein [Pyrinomonadaceae bacterium]